jgi:two-component system response regulator FlrC
MRLLIIGTLNGQFIAAAKIAKDKGANVRQVETIAAALTMLRSGQGADLIMIDVKENIKSLIDQLEAEHIHIPVIGCGFDNNSDDAVRAIKDGAKEYLPLPPDEELIAAVLAAITEESTSVISQSPAMQKIIALANQVAGSDASILITGESGTGKEVISRYIHRKSKRADKPFISVNCAAIPENLLESELFGHEKGAFTGAIAKRVGKFEEANTGTLLLDEISEIDIRLQAKLLRALQEREIDRVGGSKPVPLNIRVIATSNRDLRKEVAEGRFREDLFFRLNIINLELPSLAKRPTDIPIFAEHFIRKYAQANAVPSRPLSPEALALMTDYAWPGNVRELENTLHRAVLLTSGDMIMPEALMLPVSMAIAGDGDGASEFVGRTIDSVERDLIIGTIDHCLGDRTHAATILGISIRTLRAKLQDYGIED